MPRSTSGSDMRDATLRQAAESASGNAGERRSSVSKRAPVNGRLHMSGRLASMGRGREEARPRAAAVRFRAGGTEGAGERKHAST